MTPKAKSGGSREERTIQTENYAISGGWKRRKPAAHAAYA